MDERMHEPVNPELQMAPIDPAELTTPSPDLSGPISVGAGRKRAFASLFIGLGAVALLGWPPVGWLTSWIPGLIGLAIGIGARSAARQELIYGQRRGSLGDAGSASSIAVGAIVLNVIGAVGGVGVIVMLIAGFNARF